MTYRVRQVGDCFVLECNDRSASYAVGRECWRIIEQSYGWNYATTTAYLYRCEVV